MLRTNRLKESTKAGHVAVGCMNDETRDRSAIFVMAEAGVDYVLIDMEHTAVNVETVADLAAFAHAAGITPLVRVPHMEYPSITRILDSGIQSILVPHMSSPDEVQELLRLALYHPGGHRGMFQQGVGVNYTHVTDIAATVEHQNQNLFLGVLIETVGAVEHVEEMLVPGVDWACVGAHDLSQAYGVPGQMSHPLVTEAKTRVRQLCRERGIVYETGANPWDPGQLAAEVEQGAGMLTCSGVLGFVERGARAAVESARAAAPASADGARV